MPSPVYVSDCVKLGNLSSYSIALEKTRKTMDDYAKLTAQEKQYQLQLWWKSIKARHLKYAKNSTTVKSGSFGYFPTKDMCMADLTKLDLLFISEGKEPAFHTMDFIMPLYGINVENEFKIPSKVRFVPPMYEGKNPNAYEPALPSFDKFYIKESKDIIGWIERKCIDPQPLEMTARTMNKLRSSYGR